MCNTARSTEGRPTALPLSLPVARRACKGTWPAPEPLPAGWSAGGAGATRSGQARPGTCACTCLLTRSLTSSGCRCCCTHSSCTRGPPESQKGDAAAPPLDAQGNRRHDPHASHCASCARLSSPPPVECDGTVCPSIDLATANQLRVLHVDFPPVEIGCPPGTSARDWLSTLELC